MKAKGSAVGMLLVTSLVVDLGLRGGFGGFVEKLLEKGRRKSVERRRREAPCWEMNRQWKDEIQIRWPREINEEPDEIRFTTEHWLDGPNYTTRLQSIRVRVYVHDDTECIP